MLINHRIIIICTTSNNIPQIVANSNLEILKLYKNVERNINELCMFVFSVNYFVNLFAKSELTFTAASGWGNRMALRNDVAQY